MIKKNMWQGRYYGQEYVETEADIEQQRLEQEREEQLKIHQAKIKKFTLSALIISVVLLMETFFIFVYSTPYATSMETIAMMFIIAIIITVVYAIIMLRVYKNSNHSLTFQNLGVIIGWEIICIFFQALLTATNSPQTFFTFVGFIIAFLLYAFISCPIAGKTKVLLTVASLIMVSVTNSSYYHPCNYQTKYLYISTHSYSDDAISKKVLSDNSLKVSTYEEAYRNRVSAVELENLLSFGKTLSNQGIIDSTEKLNAVCESYKNNSEGIITNVSLLDELKKLNTYDDEFFKENALILSGIELLSTQDYTIQSHLRVSRWTTDVDLKSYYKNALDGFARFDEEKKNAMCIVVSEITKSDAELINDTGGITSANIHNKKFADVL